MLVAYNGDTPEAELFRVALPIPTDPWVVAVEADSVDDKKLNVIDSESNIVDIITGAIAVSYDALTEDLAIDVNVHFANTVI